MPRAGIALGSNLGRRLANLQAARELLRRLALPGTVLLQAPVYQTTPRDCPDGSPDFLNTVVEIGYAGTPGELLGHSQAIEAALGRSPGPHCNAPRPIDLDLLYFGDAVDQSATLQLPHARLTQRRFVLQPLADIRPDLILPGHCRTIAEHLAHCPANEPALKLLRRRW